MALRSSVSLNRTHFSKKWQLFKLRPNDARHRVPPFRIRALRGDSTTRDSSAAPRTSGAVAYLYKFLYNAPKDIEFLGNALDCLKQFPKLARREAGFQLDRVQRGLEPFDWKPMTSIGAGVREIRFWDESGTYRVLYVAKFEDTVYVLHCFHKKSQTTTKRDISLAEKRHRELLKEAK